jgi:hypothetical protein
MIEQEQLRAYSPRQTVKIQELGERDLPEDKRHIASLECHYHSRAVTHGTPDDVWAQCDVSRQIVTNAVEFAICIDAGEYKRWSAPKFEHTNVTVIFTGPSIQSTFEQALAWAEKFVDKENNEARPAGKILVLSPIKRVPSYSEVK